jgi:hypothetical protein
VLVDHAVTAWTDEAVREDRRYGRAALAVGLVGGLANLLVWALIARQTSLGWIGLLVMAIAWFLVLLRLARG